MGPYQYIGTNYNLEKYCVVEMNYDLEHISLDECCGRMGIGHKDASNIFPKMGDGKFLEGMFDGIPCIVYSLMLEDGRAIQFIWIKMD